MQICICRIRVEYRTIEEWCEILDSQRIPITAKNRIEGPYPYYGANGIQDYVNDYIFDDELVLLAEDGGNFGSKDRPIAYRVSGKCWVNNHAHVLKPKKGLDVDYLCYSLMFYNTNGLVNGATRQKLTQSTMRTMKIPCLEINEQQEIVQKIKKIESILNDLNGQLELLDELIKARFVEMFGDPVVNDKKWEIRYFGDLGELKRGKSKHRPRNDPILLGGKYPLIQTGDVTNSNTYIKSYTSTYSEEGLKQSKIWKKGTLCITIAANIAESAILTFDACFPDSVVGFTPNGEVISLFIHYWLSFLQPILEENAPAVAQKNLNVATLEKVGVIVPPLELQNQFASFVEEIDKSRLRELLAIKHIKLLLNDSWLLFY